MLEKIEREREKKFVLLKKACMYMKAINDFLLESTEDISSFALNFSIESKLKMRFKLVFILYLFLSVLNFNYFLEKKLAMANKVVLQ